MPLPKLYIVNPYIKVDGKVATRQGMPCFAVFGDTRVVKDYLRNEFHGYFYPKLLDSSEGNETSGWITPGWLFTEDHLEELSDWIEGLNPETFSTDELVISMAESVLEDSNNNENKDSRPKRSASREIYRDNSVNNSVNDDSMLMMATITEANVILGILRGSVAVRGNLSKSDKEELLERLDFVIQSAYEHIATKPINIDSDVNKRPRLSAY